MPPPGNGRETAADDESYVFVDQNHAPHRNRTASVPPTANDHPQQSAPNHRAGIRPGAPPAQRVFPPRPSELRRETAPARSYPSDGGERQRENWYTTSVPSSNGAPVYSGSAIIDSGIRMADGRDPFVTAQAFLSGYADGYGEASGYVEAVGYGEANGNGEASDHGQDNGYGDAIYAHGGYAPRYYDGHVPRPSHSPEEQEQENTVAGLGLLGVPETANESSSVTRRSAIFRHNSIASNDTTPRSSGIDYPASQHFSTSLSVPPAGSLNTLSQILGPDVNRRTEAQENRNGPVNGVGVSGASRPDSMVSSWGTVVESLGAGSLDSLEQVNNFQRSVFTGAGQGLHYGSEEEGGRTPRVMSQNAPSQAQISQSSALGLVFEPIADVASERSHSGRRPRHGRSSSMPISALEETDNRPRQRRAPRAEGDRPRTRTTSVQHHSDAQLEFSGPPEPTTTTNALALSFDGPVDHGANSQPRVDTNGRSHILAPTPIVRQNIIQSWGLGS